MRSAGRSASVRINVDMGAPVVLHAIAWGLAARDMYPTLTIHGSNATEFYNDTTARVTRDPAGLGGGVVFYANAHTLAHGAELLWQLHWTDVGSTWTDEAVAAGQADIYHTRLTSTPRYSRLFPDGRVETHDHTGFTEGHRVPTDGDGGVTTPFRFFALTISVGRLSGPGTTQRHTLELQQWQPIIDAPAATPLPTTGAAVLYGREPLGEGQMLVDVHLTKDVPQASYGYLEVWSAFRTRSYYQMAQEWTSGAFVLDIASRAKLNRTVPSVWATEGTVRPPRHPLPAGGAPAPPRTHPKQARPMLEAHDGCSIVGTAVTSLPFLWCYLPRARTCVWAGAPRSPRQRSLQPVGPQALVMHQIRGWDVGMPLDTPMRPPAWIHHRDTFRFLLVIGSARIPGECNFLTLSSETTAVVEVLDAPVGAAHGPVCDPVTPPLCQSCAARCPTSQAVWALIPRASIGRGPGSGDVR